MLAFREATSSTTTDGVVQEYQDLYEKFSEVYKT